MPTGGRLADGLSGLHNGAMREVKLAAQPRPEKGSAPARRFRREGRVPAVVYGLEADPITVTVSSQELQNVLHRVGANALINLEFDGDAMLTMAREVQRHPVKGDLVHVDFVRIRADQAVQAEVGVHLTGEPVGAKEGGVLEQVLFTVTVSAKPREIPEYLEIDVSDLKVGENKRVADLFAPEGVDLLTDPEQVVANCLVPRVLEEGPTLSADEMAELEGLSEEELEALRELAAARAAEAEVAEGEAPPEGEAADAAGEGAGGEGAAGEGEAPSEEG